ncbi:hypothetical protein Dda_7523 [Drechslerella dactyloides]|uniref:SPT2 chromatin protein n=1 Tax=Drechslerella dactyloides TaxID=74499 RepID=A0AAD6ISC2_DREDA|nr:hypothetical protein Dda_7523 [Drechslerella dactyloides]
MFSIAREHQSARLRGLGVIEMARLSLSGNAKTRPEYKRRRTDMHARAALAFVGVESVQKLPQACRSALPHRAEGRTKVGYSNVGIDCSLEIRAFGHPNLHSKECSCRATPVSARREPHAPAIGGAEAPEQRPPNPFPSPEPRTGSVHTVESNSRRQPGSDSNSAPRETNEGPAVQKTEISDLATSPDRSPPNETTTPSRRTPAAERFTMATGPGGGFSISSFLDQIEGSGGPTVAANPSTNGRGSDIRRSANGGRDGASSSVRKERPAPIGVPGRGIEVKSNTASPLHTFTPPISRALDATQDAAERKRKLEENGADEPKKKSRFEGMTKEQKVAEIKRLKALKAAREASKANGSSARDGNGSGSAASNPNSPTTAEAPSRKPAKGSYAEIMERAKQIQATAPQPAKIVHHRKVEKKKISKPDKPDPATKKSTAGPSRASISKPSASSGITKQPAAKPSARLPPAKKPEPPRPSESRAKPKPSVEWSGTARPSAVAKPSSSKPTARPSERSRERERDEREYSRDRSWERERERSRYHSPVKRYRYVESDEDEYDSDDMEATGIDILEEEDFSREVGFREDLEAEKLEREIALKKAKKMGRR